MRPRGVAFDLDGTLLRRDHTISPAMLRALSGLRERGVFFSLVSARPPRSVAEFARQIGVPGAWAALNGAVVATGIDRIIAQRSMSREVVDAVVERYVGREDVSVNLYAGFDWFVYRVTPEVASEAHAVGFAPDVLDTKVQVGGADKILLIVGPGSEDGFRRELGPLIRETAISVSQPGYVELTHANANKGEGLRAVAAEAGLNADQLMAVGDGENDLPMLRACGWPVTMGHAGDALKQVARVTLGSNDDDTLAEYVGELFSPRR